MEPKQTSLATINPDSLRTVGEMLTLGEELIKSKFTPLKTAQDVVVAILTGRELGIPTMAAVSNIHPIEGRGSLGVHLITAKLLQNGVTYRYVKDYQPVYAVYITQTGKNSKGEPATKDVVTRTIFVGEKTFDGEKVQNQPCDYRTVVELRRKVKQPDGTWVEMVIESNYSWQDAVQAGFTEKNNWKKMPKIMTRTRAFTIGARMIADDLLLGLLETSEALDAAGKNYEVDGQGNVTFETTAEVINETRTPNPQAETTTFTPVSEVVEEPIVETSPSEEAIQPVETVTTATENTNSTETQSN